MGYEIKEILGKMLEEFGEVRRQQQDMMSLRTEISRKLAEPAAAAANRGNEDECTDDPSDPSCSALRSGEVLLLSPAMLYVENEG